VSRSEPPEHRAGQWEHRHPPAGDGPQHRPDLIHVDQGAADHEPSRPAFRLERCHHHLSQIADIDDRERAPGERDDAGLQHRDEALGDVTCCLASRRPGHAARVDDDDRPVGSLQPARVFLG
jgi:hypothetical protein